MIPLFKKYYNRSIERNISLLVLNFIYIFVWGLTTGKTERIGFGIILSLIFIFAVRSVKERFSKLFYFVAITLVILWISFFLELRLIMLISNILSVLFFIVVVVFLVIKLAKAKTISAIEFLEAINIYFFIGIIGSILLTATYHLNPNSFNSNTLLSEPADFIYFSFVTLTSLGYGDISPVSPIAKSISIFLSFSGQIYLAMIISMLVGKYLSAKST